MDEVDIKVAVAFSGGVDSSTSLIYMKKLGLKTIAITVKAGPYIISRHLEDEIKNFVYKNKVKIKIVNLGTSFHEIVEKAMMGHRVPCGECHKVTEKTVYNEMMKENIRVIAFGDLLLTDQHSLHFDKKKEILRINLPALTKTETAIIARQHGHTGIKFKYGCPLLRLKLKGINILKSLQFKEF